MGRETDYISQYSYQLYDTTGTTDDYIYDGLGGFSYTPEIGKDEFHPAYADYVPEYDGQFAEDANGNPTTQKLGGLRGAYTRAVIGDGRSGYAGTTTARADRQRHPGHRAGRPDAADRQGDLRTDQQPARRRRRQGARHDHRAARSTLQVPDNGQFVWHVNPSSQPPTARRRPGS